MNAGEDVLLGILFIAMGFVLWAVTRKIEAVEIRKEDEE